LSQDSRPKRENPREKINNLELNEASKLLVAKIQEQQQKFSFKDVYDQSNAIKEIYGIKAPAPLDPQPSERSKSSATTPRYATANKHTAFKAKNCKSNLDVYTNSQS